MAEKKNNKSGSFAGAQDDSKGGVKRIHDDVLYGGKIPPQSRELEMNVLGGCMIDNQLIDIVSGIINKPDMFYVTANQDIWKAMLLLRDKRQPVDMITVTQQLMEMGMLEQVGGPAYLAEISTAFSSQESIAFSATKIKENWVKRDMILLTFSLNEQCYDPAISVEDLIGKAQKEVIEIGNELDNGKDESLDTSFKLMVEEAEKRVNSKDEKMSGIPCYISDFNEKTGGWQRQELQIMAGRPSHGKSAAAFRQALYSAEHGYKVGIFSIEMGETELMMRMAAIDQEIDIIKFKIGTLTDEDFEKMAVTYKKFMRLKNNLFIDYRNPLNVQMFKSKCREWKMKYGLDMVIVDYLQLMDSGKSDKYWESTNNDLGYITRGIKQTAKELDMAAIVLSQLNRKIEERPVDHRKPTLADLRDSGNIEQDADLVLFITRPEVWISKDSPKYIDVKGIANWDIAKQRNGPIGEFKTTFRAKYAKFVNYPAEYESSMPGNYNHGNDEKPF